MQILGVRKRVLSALGVVIALVGILIAVDIPAAASITTAVGNAVVGAAGFVSVYLILWMVDQFSGT